MKIFNIKISHYLVWGIIFLFLFILGTFYFIHQNKIIHMTNQNYTSVLRDSHQNIANYIGKKITTSGYIFRNKDFSSHNFVIARDMLINETQSNIVGFLCSYEYAEDFQDNEWVEATGTIKLGDYYGPIPMIQVEAIHKITTPNDIFVFPPKK